MLAKYGIMTDSGDPRFRPVHNSHRQTGLAEFGCDTGPQQEPQPSQTRWPLFTDDLPADVAQPGVTSRLNDTCAVLATRDDMTTELIMSGLEAYIKSVLTGVAPINPPQTVDPVSVFSDRLYMRYPSQFRPVYINLDATAKTLITDSDHTPHDIYTGARELLAILETRCGD